MQEHDPLSGTGRREPVPTLVPHASRFFARPATRAGHWAAWTSLIAFAALIVFNVLTGASERQDSGTVYDAMQATRLIIFAIFAISGLGALAFSLRSLMRSERSIMVWAALAVGLFATTLIIGEFTFLE